MEIGITLVMFVITLAVGYFIGYANGKNHLGYHDGYIDGYNDALTKNNPTEKIKNTKYNTRY